MGERQPDPVMERSGQAIERSRAGRHVEARNLFDTIWNEICPAGVPFHRCVLAHYDADVQLEIDQEPAWDLRALAAADELTDELAGAYHDSLAVGGFYRSLHLNLAEDYRKLGESDRAREHLALDRSDLGSLGDDAYGNSVSAAVDRAARDFDDHVRTGQRPDGGEVNAHTA